MVVGKRLDDHPRAVFRERLADVRGGADGIAHVMQAVEDGDQVVVSARETISPLRLRR